MNKSSTFWELFCSLPPAFSLLSPPSGLSLFSSGRTCPWPLPPNENSEAHLLSPTHSFSALFEVRCKPGFTLPNGLDATIRRCQGDRQWSGDEPICTGRFEFNRKIFLCHFRSLHNGIHNTGNICVYVCAWCWFFLKWIYCSLSYLTKATGWLNVHGTRTCVTDGQGINITQCLYKTNTEREREWYWGMKPLCDGVDWDIAQLGPILLVTIATRALVVHIGFLEILHLNC